MCQKASPCEEKIKEIAENVGVLINKQNEIIKNLAGAPQ